MNPDDDGFVEKDTKEDADFVEHEDIKAEMDDGIDVRPKKKKAKDGRAGNKGAGRKSVDTFFDGDYMEVYLLNAQKMLPKDEKAEEDLSLQSSSGKDEDSTSLRSFTKVEKTEDLKQN